MEILELFRVVYSFSLRVIPGVFCMVMCFGAVYMLIYIKLLKEVRKIKIITPILTAILILYLILVLEVTVLNRAGFEGSGSIEPLMTAYKDAWYKWSAMAWRNIILNVCMFIPLGFLLPLLGGIFRRFWVTYLCGAALTVIIEALQLIFNRGIFSIDDLIDNTLGAMIGYGLYSAFVYIINRRDDKCKTLRRNTVYSQIPLCAAILVMVGILAAYNTKELGNIQYKLISNTKTLGLEVRKNYEYFDEKTSLPVYKTDVFSAKTVKIKCLELLKGFGENTEKIKFTNHDGTIWAEGDNGSVVIMFDSVGGMWSYSNYRLSKDITSGKLKMYANATEDDVASKLKSFGIMIPSGYYFEEVHGGTYQYVWDKVLNGTFLIDGTMQVTLCGNGNLLGVRYSVQIGKYYKEFEVISENEAYKKIRNGEFYYFVEPYSYIELDSCEIIYDLDSKGFMQPLYIYSGKINYKPVTLRIPAIK